MLRKNSIVSTRVDNGKESIFQERHVSLASPIIKNAVLTCLGEMLNFAVLHVVQKP